MIRGGAGRPLRVAYLFNHEFFLGGGERSTAELIRALDRAAVEPLVLLPGPGELRAHFEAAGVAVAEVPLPALRRLPSGAPLRALRDLAATLRERRVDVLHTGSTRGCLYGGLAGRLAGVPVIWHVRESLRDPYWYDRLLAALSARLVCVSGAVRERRFGRFGAGVLERAVVVRNAVDTDRMRRDPDAGAEYRRSLGLEPGALVFGLVGNVIERKGHDVCVAALAGLLGADPACPVRLLFAGRDDLEPEYARRVRGLVRAAGLGERVVFAPFTENLAGLYSALDALVLPSRSEGFSRVLIEGMSMGLPVAASDLAEIREAVPDERHGLLSPYGDSEALGANLARLAADAALREAMGHANRERAGAEFGLAAHAARVGALYAELAGGAR